MLAVFNNTVYVWLKTVHILAAVVWVGGGVATQFYATRLMRAHDTQRLMAFAKDTEAIGNKVFLPASVVVLLLGITLVWYGPYEVTTLWVILGLVGIANTIVIGAAFLGPEAGRLAALAQERGPEDPEVQRRIARIFTISRIDLSVLILVIVVMVTKPTL
jgi:uncharacterized membrane protein